MFILSRGVCGNLRLEESEIQVPLNGTSWEFERHSIPSFLKLL